MELQQHLSGLQKKRFATEGVLVIPGFYDEKDVLPIQKVIYDVIGKVMQRHDVEDDRGLFDPENFDAVYLELIARHRGWGGEVYDAIKMIPAFLRLVAHPTHEWIFRKLRPGAMPGVAGGGYGIRTDNPFEDRFRAMWHQEYPAQLRSLDGF